MSDRPTHQPPHGRGSLTDDEASDADSFDDREEKTSPEVVRHQRRIHLGGREDQNPIAVVAISDAGRRRYVLELLVADGWNGIDARDADELFEVCRAVTPQVAIIDFRLARSDGTPIPEALRAHRPDAAMRTLVMLEGGVDPNVEIAHALAEGYDDFVGDPDNEVEILSRANANLRAARSLAEIHKQRRDAASLLELSQTLASSLDMQLILHTVSRLITQVIALERCAIVLLDPDHDDAVMVAASEDRAVRDLRIRLSNYPEVKRCVESAAPILIEDAQKDPILTGVRSNVVDKGVRAMALFPIVFEERVTGVLFLRSSKVSRRLSELEVQFGQTVAAACAVAIRNARLFDQFRDQTERINSMRMMAERQTEALRKYEDFFEYAADGMAIIDADARILYVNREGRRLMGRERDELLEACFVDFLADESRLRWPEVVDQVRHGRFKRSFDVYVSRRDGSERIFSLSAGGVGQSTGLIILSFRDVTETREMEMELRTTKEFLENLIDNSVDAIVAADMNGNIMLFNKGAERIYGYRAEEVIGRMHVSQLYPSGVATDVMRQLRDERFGGRGRLEAQRKEIVTASGDVVPVSMTASIIYEDGEEVATVGVFTDLRDRITIERRLSEAQDQLMKTEKARVAAELAGMAAHELNQPLTSVLGYAEMLKNKVPESDTRLRRPIETIFRQAERMAEIVRKIGRITKYETKRYGLNTDMIDLNRAAPEGGPEIDTSGAYPLAPMNADESAENPVAPGGRGPSLMAALASMPTSRASIDPSVDPRAAVVRLDTVDAPAASGYVRNLREREKERPATLEEDSGAFLLSPTRVDTLPALPAPRALSIQIPMETDADDHTNPGVRMSETRPLGRRPTPKPEK